MKLETTASLRRLRGEHVAQCDSTNHVTKDMTSSRMQAHVSFEKKAIAAVAFSSQKFDVPCDAVFCLVIADCNDESDSVI